MIPALPAPPAELIPYLLQQAGLRASLLTTNFSFAADDWEDMRQDLALDCLRRLPKFDPTRGAWKPFVHGVVRNHASVLAVRQARRFQSSMLAPEAEDAITDELSFGATHATSGEDPYSELDLRLDVQRVVNNLPEELRTITHHLAHLSFFAVCRRTGLTHHQLKRKIERIRAAFVAAGLTPAKLPGSGGRR